MILPKSETTITSNSGNVFADLSLPDPELRALKADLAIHVRPLVEREGLTQDQAAELSGLSQAAYSIEHLFLLVNWLGCDVEVRITLAQSAPKPARIVVTAA